MSSRMSKPAAPVQYSASAILRQVSGSRTLTPALVFGFVGIILVLIAARLIGTLNLRNVHDTSAAVAHTYSVKAALERLLSTLVDAETGERGFIITGEPSYLEPYDRARASIPSAFEQVRTLTADNGEQHADLDRLSALVQVKLQQLAEGVRQRRESGLEAAQSVVATNIGKHTMDAMRALISGMEAREDTLQAARTAQAERSYAVAWGLGFVTTGLALLVAIALFAGAWRTGKARLRAAETAESLRVMLASIGDAVITTDSSGRVTFVNHVAETLTGWKQDEAAGKSLEDVFQIVNEQTRQPVASPALLAMSEGRIVGLANHTVLIARNGTEIPIDDSGSPIKDTEGITVGAVLIFRDVTERRRADQQRELLADQARMLNSGFDAIIVRDSHDRIVSWNRVAEELYGWPAEQALGQVTHVVFKTRFPKPLAEITQDLHRDGRWEGELVHTRKDGSSVTVLSHWVLDNSQDQTSSILEINIDISARKRVEEALRENRELLRITLSSIGDAVIATDTKGAVTFLNSVAVSLTGWNGEDALGRPLQEVFNIISEQTRQPVENLALRSIQEGIILGLANHTVLVARDGTERPIDDAGSPIRDTEGKTLGAVLIFRDISGRRRLERAQAELLDSERNARESERNARMAAEAAEQRLQLALDAGRMGTWEYSVGTGGILWSQGLEQIHGYKSGTFPGTFDAFRDQIHPHDRELVLRAIREAIERRQDYFIEYRIVRKDGTIRWVEGRGRLSLDADGNPDRMAGVCADITDRKQAEARFRLAVEAAPAAMLMVDAGGTIVLANALAEQLLGYTRNEIVGLRIEHLVPARFRGQHLEYRMNYLAGASQRPMGAGRDLYAVRKDGSEVAVEIGLSPIQTADGVVVIAAVTDITERKRAAEAESQARRHAEEALRVKDEFLAMLSHELRSPLSAILGWAGILRRGEVQVDASHALEVIERNARLEAQLVESLLDLSRIAAGKLELVKERVDLLSVLQTVVDSLRPAANAKGITLDVAAQPGPVVVIGDSGRLQQIFSNLLTNALKFTSRDGHVQVRLTRIGSQAQIQVIDDGQGIDADFLPHIFDRFRQAESARSRAHGGLGLGLAIVRELVQAHGGTAVAESQGKGQGSTFTVTFPIPAVMLSHVEAAKLKLGHAEEPSISGLRILVVDDDADARELVAMALESHGAVVLLASSSEEAFESVKRHKPEIMVADIGLAHEDGYVLIQKLRQLEGDNTQQRLSAIALTAYASAADRDQALATGYDLHLTKPVSPGELTQAVAKFRKSRAT
jgi:PAS domain S-box-containing protein